LKQNCGVRPGAGDGRDMADGDGEEGEGGEVEGDAFQKYFARIAQFQVI